MSLPPWVPGVKGQVLRLDSQVLLNGPSHLPRPCEILIEVDSNWYKIRFNFEVLLNTS